MKQRIKNLLGSILCKLDSHKWESYRVVREEDLADLQPEEGGVVKNCTRATCQASKGYAFIDYD